MENQNITPLVDPALPIPKKHLSFTLRKQIVTLGLLVLFVIAGSAVYFLSSKSLDLRSRASLSGPVLTLVPGDREIKAGDKFSVGVMLNTRDETVSAVDLNLSYDPASIRVTDFTPETQLPVVLSPAKFADGTISISLGVQPTSPFKGASLIGKFSVVVLNSKNSSIKFTPNTKVASLGKNTNSLESTTGVSLTTSATTPSDTTTTKVETPPVTPTEASAARNENANIPQVVSKLSISTSGLPGGKVGSPYSSVITINKTAKTGNPSVTISGLPFGIYQSSCAENNEETQVKCEIAGTPAKAGLYAVKVSVSGDNSASAERDLPLSIK